MEDKNKKEYKKGVGESFKKLIDGINIEKLATSEELYQKYKNVQSEDDYHESLFILDQRARELYEDEELVQKYKNVSIEQFREIENQDLKNSLIKTLAITDLDPFFFFYRLSEKERKEWFEEIWSIEFKEVLNSNDISTKDKVKLIKWLKKFNVFYNIETKRRKEIAYYSSIQEQIYILRTLLNIKTTDITHSSINSIKDVLSLLLNRGGSNSLTKWKLFDGRNVDLSISSLEKIKKVFKQTENKTLLDQIQKDIDFKNNKKNIK